MCMEAQGAGRLQRHHWLWGLQPRQPPPDVMGEEAKDWEEFRGQRRSSVRRYALLQLLLPAALPSC